MTLTEFLLARIAEDEEFLPGYLAEVGGATEYTDPNDGLRKRFDFPDAPARVLAECAAKRRIVAEHGYDDSDTACQSYAGNWMYEPCRTLRALALPYADHPDYRDDWRP